MADSDKDKMCFTPVFVARQPVFDATQRVWGYEFYFREDSEATTAQCDDLDKASMEVTAGAIVSPFSFFDMGRKMLINFDQQSILDSVPYSLPSGQTVVQVPTRIVGVEKSPQIQDTMHALMELKEDGYLIALDDFSPGIASPAALELADILIVDVLGKKRDCLGAAVNAARGHTNLIMAKRVEDGKSYSMAKEQGFTLFQGFFFKKPEIVAGRKLTSHEISRLNLLRSIEQEQPDYAKLAEDVQSDVSVSYRLLSYLNSAAFGFPQKINTIKQALVLLGWKQLKNWLRVVILTDLTPGKKSSELSYLAVQRGKFLELTARNHKLPGEEPEKLFLLGLFSLLEVMLDMAMQEIVERLPFEQDLNDALCRKPGSKYLAWLDMVNAFETAEWEVLDRTIQELELNRLLVAMTYYESIPWAKAFFLHGR